jgi:hypothetical protein
VAESDPCITWMDTTLVLYFMPSPASEQWCVGTWCCECCCPNPACCNYFRLPFLWARQMEVGWCLLVAGVRHVHYCLVRTCPLTISISCVRFMPVADATVPALLPHQ